MSVANPVKESPLGDFYWFQEGPGVRNWQFQDSGIKLLNVANIEKSGNLNLDKTSRYLSVDEVQTKYSHFLIDSGDLVIASSGISFDVDGMLRTRGAFVNDSHLPLCLNTSTIRFKAKPGVSDLGYLKHWLDSLEFREEITKRVTGSAQQNFGPSHLKAIKITLPPLPEQRRIAAILDQADALRARRREALAQLDSLTQSIFIEMFGDPATGASTLNFLPLESLLEESFQNGAYFPKETYCESGGAEMVHMSDAFGGCVKRGHLKRVNCSNADIKKYALTTNDILIARRSLTYEGAAKPCMIPSATEPLIFESSFIRVRPDRTKITPLYLFHYLNNDRVKKSHIRPYVTQSTISGINQSNLAQVPVLHPPLELQQKFGARVQSIENVRRTQVNSLVELDTLFASLQHRAFRGDL